MGDIWRAARDGDVGEVERLLGHDPGLLNAKGGDWRRMTPLMWASQGGHVNVVRCLLDKGAAINKHSRQRLTALWWASSEGRLPVVRLLLERGADPTIATDRGSTPLIAASRNDDPEVVRVLLDHPSAKATIDRRDDAGETALWLACYCGRGGVVRALLESGADPTIANNEGTTPMAVAKQLRPFLLRLEEDHGCRWECEAALKVRSCIFCSPPPLDPALLISWLRRGAWWLTGGGAGLPALEGPAGGRCGCELRGTAGGGTEDAGRGQASSRGGSAGGAEGSCGGGGRRGATGRVGGADERRGGGGEEGGAAGACGAVAEARCV
jgi:hypothetical protein